MELKDILYNLLIHKDVSKAIEQIEEQYTLTKKENLEDILEFEEKQRIRYSEKLRKTILEKVNPSFCLRCHGVALRTDIHHENQVYGWAGEQPMPIGIKPTPGDPNTILIAFDKRVEVKCKECGVEYGTTFRVINGKVADKE